MYCCLSLFQLTICKIWQIKPAIAMAIAIYSYHSPMQHVNNTSTACTYIVWNIFTNIPIVVATLKSAPCNTLYCTSFLDINNSMLYSY